MFGASKCGHCGGTTWELVEVSAQNAAYKHHFIQCSACDVPVGVLDYFNVGAKIVELGKRVQHVGELVTDVMNRVKHIEQHLARSR